MYSEYYNLGGTVFKLSGDILWKTSDVYTKFLVPQTNAGHTINVRIGGAFPEIPAYAVRNACRARWQENGCLFQLLRYGDYYRAYASQEGFSTDLLLSESHSGALSARGIFEASCPFDMLAAHGMLVLHAAYIITRGGAILFSGASGAGKSTQAELWRKYAGARIVNGDRALLRLSDATAHGIFFSGTSRICENASAPIRAIIFPEKSQRNAITVPRPREAFALLLSQCSYYPWDADSTSVMTGLAARLAEQLPIYRMECRRDESAVRALSERLPK